jgi:hypothetical protein
MPLLEPEHLASECPTVTEVVYTSGFDAVVYTLVSCKMSPGEGWILIQDEPKGENRDAGD